MRVLLLIVCFSAIIAGCGPTSRYEVIGDQVVFNTRRGPSSVSEADVTTFRPIGGLFAKDARHVFYGEDVVEGADPLSFSVIDAQTGRDAKSIYRASGRCDECDFESFQRVGDDWYIDKNAVYSALNDGWKRTERANSGSLTVINDWFAKDSSNVYLSGYRIAGADAASFKLASCGVCKVCGEDKNRCYWNDQAVPCDCKPHNGGDFAWPLPETAPGKARVRTLEMKSPVYVVSVDGVAEKAYLNFELAAGEHVLGLNCLDAKTGLAGTLPIKVKAGRLYRLEPFDDQACGLRLQQHATVRGKAFGPEIRLDNVPGSVSGVRPNGVLEAVLPSGRQTLTFTCRDVTRETVRQASSHLELELAPGYFYQVDASFNAPENKCDVRVVTAEPL